MRLELTRRQAEALVEWIKTATARSLFSDDELGSLADIAEKINKKLHATQE